MLCYDMLSYAMVWYRKNDMLYMRFQCHAMRFLMLCYAMVYVVKDKHSATVPVYR